MNRIARVALCIAATTLFFSGCGNQSDISAEKNTQQTNQTNNRSMESEKSVSQNGIITEDEAKEIALKDAGVAEDEVTGIRIQLEFDDGRWEYEIEFYVGTTEYEYKIEGESGKIIEKEMDRKEITGTVSTTENSISEAEAKALALAKVPGAGENDIRLYLDYDDGKMIYEGSIVYEGIKYEFEIDASAGTVREWKEESVFD